MNLPGFTAVASLPRSAGHAHRSARPRGAAAADGVVPQIGFGGFGPTLPSCHYEKQWVPCGSPLPGYPTPMCLDWVYVCKFPGSSRTLG